MKTRNRCERYGKCRLSTLVLLLGMMLFLSCTSRPPAADIEYQVLGKEPIAITTDMEDHSEALLFWAKHGFNDLIVVHVDEHDDMSVISDDKIDEINQLIAQQDWSKLEGKRDLGFKSLYLISDYLYAAAKTGLVRKVYWIVPHDVFSGPDPETKVKRFLAANCATFPAEDINAMRFRDSCLQGDISGIDFVVCPVENLPAFDEPILLDIDLDYFQMYARERQLTCLEGLKRFFDILYSKNLKVAAANLAFSLKYGFSRSIHRYIGDAVITVFNNPRVLQNDNRPAVWDAADQTESFFKSGDIAATISHLDKSLRAYPDSPALCYLNAAIMAYIGNIDESLAQITRTCRLDERYRYGFLDIIMLLMSNNRLEEATRFCELAIELYPGWTEAMHRYANLLFQQGEYRRMIEISRKVEKAEDHCYLQFLIGLAYFRLGQRDDALERFERGMNSRSQRLSTEFVGGNLELFQTMIRLYRERGNDMRVGEVEEILRIGGF